MELPDIPAKAYAVGVMSLAIFVFIIVTTALFG